MGIPDEKTPAELEKGSDDDAMMYTGRVDAREYGTLKREYVASHAEACELCGLMATAKTQEPACTIYRHWWNDRFGTSLYAHLKTSTE
jgi:hypothetical protein